MIDALLSWILYVGIVILCIYMVWFATVAHRMSEEGLREGFKLCLGSSRNCS